MKPVKEMTQIELAAYIQSHLREVGINVVLSGGAAVAFYSGGRYISKDLDLINVQFTKRSKLKAAIERIGFQEKRRYFENPDTEYFVEFPNGPLSVGQEPMKEISEIELATGILRIISPTDCVKDRLCTYYFWGDKQGLAQALLVAQNQRVDIREIERWSKEEGKGRQFEDFHSRLG